ncbi:hypothetical protein IQ241_09760 [Romeria aff. gracilis LEGE 07310]|uniref:Uncharacterized protein n=1 Tax=Vasconcelosia minhoensis LEGE 07310 TaxID=915328 RepID=A0A8J7AHD2_9CYAN|nr:hypothetical protein [Romeria gracilis]MBE9077578.1 hypothetical protein [Romeria aff. gracilis LEGE 07310]
MDRSILILAILSVVLVSFHSPTAVLTLGAILVLSAVATRASWAVLQAFSDEKSIQRAAQRIWD